MKIRKLALGLCLVLCFSLPKLCAQNQFKVLLFTLPDQWHYKTIPVAVQAFKEMSEKNQFDFDWTQEPEDLRTKLDLFDVVVFMNARVDSLNQEQIASLKSFINNGGGFVGIHATSSSRKRVPWFDQLVGGVFVNHPKFQSGIIEVEDPNFPATLHLPDRWLWSDEWYNFTFLDFEKLNVILKVDESTYDYTAGYDEIPLKGMKPLHPIAWYHEFEGGRVFYTALGHRPEAYLDQQFLDHLFGGIYWVKRKPASN